MKGCFLIFWLLLSSVAVADDTEWQLINEGSFIKFSVNIQGNSVGGEFTKFSTDIIFDPLVLEQSRINVLIDLNHIDAAYSDVSNNLKNKDWFDVENFPIARFSSRNFKHLSGNEYQASGDLTLRDITRTAVLNFTLKAYDRHTAAIEGRMALNRLDYGVGQGAWRDETSVGAQVLLDVVITVVKR